MGWMDAGWNGAAFFVPGWNVGECSNPSAFYSSLRLVNLNVTWPLWTGHEEKDATAHWKTSSGLLGKGGGGLRRWMVVMPLKCVPRMSELSAMPI